MDTTGITPVMNVGGSDGGLFGGNGFLGIFGLLILVGLLNGGFGGFGGGNQQYATRDQVQNGFDNQNQQMLASGILGAVNNGTAQTVAATNQTFHDTLAAMQGLYNETARDIAALGVGQAQILANQNNCCCETKQLIMQGNYENAMQLAGLEQRITAKMDAQEITNLRDQLNNLQLQMATCNVLRFPNSWTFAGGVFPPAAAAA